MLIFSNELKNYTTKKKAPIATPLHGRKKKERLKTNNFSTDKSSLSLLKQRARDASNGTADRNMEARMPTTKYGLRKRYRWLSAVPGLAVYKYNGETTEGNGWRERGRWRARRRRDGDIRLVGWLVGHRPEVYESRPQCGARSGPQCYLYGGIKLSEKGTSIFRVTPR